MTELIGELTELARGEEQNEPLEEVRLDLLTEEAIRRATRHHPDVPIEAELAPSTVVGQPASLERAITNLLDNAAKWSPAGSPVEVHLADGELTVRDHGPGIAAEDVPHVFERFYRATSARGMPGSGLGLAIVQAGRGEPRRHDRGRGAGGRRHADAAEHSRSRSGAPRATPLKRALRRRCFSLGAQCSISRTSAASSFAGRAGRSSPPPGLRSAWRW